MKSIILFTGFLVFSALIFSSCATTETTSFVDPAFRGKQFSKICVLADVSDLKYKQKLEREFMKNLAEKNVNVTIGSQLFPPTREWSQEQMQEILLKEGIDGYLLVTWKDKGVQETYHPGQAVSETKGEVKKKDGKDVYTERTVTTQTNGSVDKEFRSYFEAKLIDVLTKNNAWIATSYSSSGEWMGSDFDLIMESYSSDIVEKLKNDGMIR
jgi:hypothetical protein